MIPRSEVRKQLEHTVEEINAPELGEKIPGKVRDSFVVERGNEQQRVIVTTDRLSAFDKVLTTIPFKGQLLNQMASHWFEQTKHIVPNHIISVPHQNVLVARQVQILPVEVIIRGYIAGSAWRDYQAGKLISGIKLPDGLKKSQRFAEPILTPSTKAEMGEHDMPISSEEIVSSGLVEKSLWNEVSRIALELFRFGSIKAEEQGLILVDTKYEFGIIKDGSSTQVVLADEVHTQDSSRYWKRNSYEERFNAGEEPEMLDKEFVRGWLIEKHNYMGDGTPPKFDDEFRVDTALKYMEAFETITGIDFQEAAGDQTSKIEEILKTL